MRLTADRMAEIVEWRAVVGFEGLYEVSNTGLVRRILFRNRNVSRPCCRYMKQAVHNRYARVYLSKNNSGSGRAFLVHGLVLDAFHGPRAPGQVCRHLDGNSLNNHRDNLKWGTPAENTLDKELHGTILKGKDNPNAKLTDDDVRQIRAMFGKIRVTEISKKFGIVASAIYAIGNGTRWKHI